MDCVDLDTNEKVYPITHAKAVYTEDGKTLQEKFDNGEYVDEAQVQEMIKGKQDFIDDLEAIRSGASAGATALQSVPEGYATKEYVDEKIGNINAVLDAINGEVI